MRFRLAGCVSVKYRFLANIRPDTRVGLKSYAKIMPGVVGL